MGDKTPKRSTSTLNTGFSPVSLPESPAASPQKNLTGLPRLVKDLAADVYNCIQKWNGLHVKGAGIIKEVASVKSDNPKDFSDNLEKLINDLYTLVQTLRHYKDTLLALAMQIRASEKLQKSPEPVFISLDVNSIAKLVEDISKAYDAEFNTKNFVLESVAYAKNKDEAMFLAALWTYQTRIPDCVSLKLETLLIETGHRKVT